MKRALLLLALAGCGTAVEERADQGRPVMRIVGHPFFSVFRFQDGPVTCWVAGSAGGIFCLRDAAAPSEVAP